MLWSHYVSARRFGIGRLPALVAAWRLQEIAPLAPEFAAALNMPYALAAYDVVRHRALELRRDCAHAEQRRAAGVPVRGRGGDQVTDQAVEGGRTGTGAAKASNEPLSHTCYLGNV